MLCWPRRRQDELQLHLGRSMANGRFSQVPLLLTVNWLIMMQAEAFHRQKSMAGPPPWSEDGVGRVPRRPRSGGRCLGQAFGLCCVIATCRCMPGMPCPSRPRALGPLQISPNNVVDIGCRVFQAQGGRCVDACGQESQAGKLVRPPKPASCLHRGKVLAVLVPAGVAPVSSAAAPGQRFC